MEAEKREFVERALRVRAPILLTFKSGSYAVREFAQDISESGAFLPTDRLCDPGVNGTLTLQATQFDRPLVFEAQVVRAVPQEMAPDGRPAGLGVQFLGLTEQQLTQLRNLVEGVHSGTVVDSIRRSLREAGATLGEELRKRPADQKMMLALSARGEEITALIRDGHPSVMMRLLECPHLNATHVVTMMRNPNLPTQVLSAIKRHSKYISNPEVRFLFTTHQNTMLPHAMEQLRLLPPDRLRRVAAMPQLKLQLRARAGELSRQGRTTRMRR
jgi:hypothetical protein